MRRAVRITAIALAILAGIAGVSLVVLFFAARSYVNDGDVPAAVLALLPLAGSRVLLARGAALTHTTSP